LEAILDGRLEEAIAEGDALVQLVAEQGAILNPSALSFKLPALLYLGRVDEALALTSERIAKGGVRETLAEVGRRAVFLAHLGRVDEVSHLFLQLTPDAVAQLPVRDLADFLEAAVIAGLLRPTQPISNRFLNVPAFLANDGTTLSAPLVPAARLLGAALSRLGDTHGARASYLGGLDVATKIRHRPETALTRLQLAELLLTHYPDERTEALEHVDFAIAEFRDMKMQPSLERALKHKGLLRA